MIESSSELQELIMGEIKNDEPVCLAPRDYEIYAPEDGYRHFNFHSANKYATRVHVRGGTLLVGANSDIHQVTFHALTEKPLIALDHSSRAEIYKCFFDSKTAANAIPDADKAARSGYGIVTTEDSISEDNWGVVIRDNEFRFFRNGILIGKPGISPIGNRQKGTSYWDIIHNGFDGCAVAIRAKRGELLNIERNHIQLHKVGIELVGCHTCWLTKNDFERGSKQKGAWDIRYSSTTCHIDADGNTAPPERINKYVDYPKLHNEYRNYVRKLNIWADCGKGENEASEE